MRTKFLDYDARRKPKTSRYCVKCQRDFRVGDSVRVVRVNGVAVVHPEDVTPGIGEDYLIGIQCAKVLGWEWTRPER